MSDINVNPQDVNPQFDQVMLDKIQQQQQATEAEEPETTTQWILKNAEKLPEDPLLNALIFITQVHLQPKSSEALVTGLPMEKGVMTPDLFIRAAKRANLTATCVKRPLRKISHLALPVVLLLWDQQACILTGFTKDKKAIIVLPETTAHSIEIPMSELAKHYSGFGLFIKPDFQYTERSQQWFCEKPKHWFWSVMFKAIPTYSEVIVASILINLFAIAVPLFTMNVYDRVVPNQAIDTLWVLASGVAIVFIFDFLMKMMRAYFIDIASKNIDQRLSASIFEQVLGIKMAERPKSVGAFTNTVQSYEAFREFITSSTMVLIVDLPFIAFFILVIAMIGGSLFWIPTIIVPIVLTIGLLLQIPLTRLTKESFMHASEKYATLIESISAAETIKSTGSESPMQRRWETVIALAAKIGIKMRLLTNATTNITMLATQISTVLIVILGVYKIADGDLTTGALIACVILNGRALAPMGQIAGLMTRYHHAKIAMDSLTGIMKKEVDRAQDRTPLHRPDWEGNIEFKDVSFAYPNEQVLCLDKINLKIRTGERVGIIGRIGSGKTTLAKLLLNLYQPTEGTLFIDNTDIQQFDPAQLRHNIGYVPQDITLFFGSIKDNIILSAPYVDDTHIIRAAQISGVDDFVKTHPQGYDLQVGEAGLQLSGGQRQAIAIARSLLSDPNLVVFDEPTNSMDDNTEATLKKRLTTYLNGKTLVLVTHRRSMLSLVNRLVLMDNGKIIADGPKETVLAALGSTASTPPKPRKIVGQTPPDDITLQETS